MVPCVIDANQRQHGSTHKLSHKHTHTHTQVEAARGRVDVRTTSRLLSVCLRLGEVLKGAQRFSGSGVLVLLHLDWRGSGSTRPVFKGAPSRPVEETGFGRLYPWPRSKALSPNKSHFSLRNERIRLYSDKPVCGPCRAVLGCFLRRRSSVSGLNCRQPRCCHFRNPVFQKRRRRNGIIFDTSVYVSSTHIIRKYSSIEGTAALRLSLCFNGHSTAFTIRGGGTLPFLLLFFCLKSSQQLHFVPRSTFFIYLLSLLGNFPIPD